MSKNGGQSGPSGDGGGGGKGDGGSPQKWYKIDDKYYTRTYGGYERLFPSDRLEDYGKLDQFVNASDFYPKVRYGDAYRSNHKEVQVNTIQSGPKVPVTYEEKCVHEINDWGANTSAHGIPQIVRSENLLVKLFWVALYLICLGNFFYQAAMVVNKFNRNEKIVDIELKFEAAPFPAITLCNLNPYKDRAVQKVKMVTRMLSAFKGAMNSAVDEEEEGGDGGGGDGGGGHHIFKRDTYLKYQNVSHEDQKREIRRQLYQVLKVYNETLTELFGKPKTVKSSIKTKSDESKTRENSTTNNRTILDNRSYIEHRRRVKREEEQHHKVYFEVSYSHCTCVSEEEGGCSANKEQEPPDKKDMCLCAFDRHTNDAWPCHKIPDWEKTTCDTCNEEGYCPRQMPGGPEPEKGQSAECFCYEGFCIAWDGSAILNLWEYYGMGAPTEDPGFLEAMGFSGMTDEVAIVTKAKENMMFAMSALSMEERRSMSYSKEEFVHKCSFNGKQCDLENDFITRVDPTFGLRLVLFVGDGEDELQTTEARGIRMTVHDKDQFPFPDTFGYSAPTGSISSFGVRLKSVDRLPAPYGNCIPGGNMRNYIYEGYGYSVEGCFRSCFQMLVIQRCQCGDPRFPVPEGKCLEESTKDLGGMEGEFSCSCSQPCKQSMYDVTYSAAIWPAGKLKVTPPGCKGGEDACRKVYGEYGAMIEVFYEQLNFEMLIESSAYGVSVMTCFEILTLVLNFGFVSGQHQYLVYKKNKLEKERQKNSGG